MYPFRFGVTEVRKDEQSGGLFAGAGVSVAESVFAIALAPFLMGFLGLAIWKLWPDWDERIAVGILVLLIGVCVAWFLLFIGIRIAELAGAWNRGKAIHRTEQGATFLHRGKVFTHSHKEDTLPPTSEGVEDEYEDYGPMNMLAAAGRKPPKTYRDMVRTGIYGHPDANLVLAFEDNGAPIDLPNLTSIGIGGVQGSGKTVTTLVLMLEIIAKYNGRVKFLVVDPQLYAQSGGQSLTSKIKDLEPFFLQAPGLPNPTVGTAELQGWMQFIKAEQDRRQGGGDWQDVWVIVMDEFAQIMSNPERAEAVLPVLRSVNSVARQLEIFAILVSYEWLARIMDGTELRHAIATFAVHNMTENIAALLVPSDVARQAPKLRPGQVLFYSLGRTRIGRVPFADATDAKSAVARYGPTITPINRGSGIVDANRFDYLQPVQRGAGRPDPGRVSDASDVSSAYTQAQTQEYSALTGEPTAGVVDSTLNGMPPLAELDRLPSDDSPNGLPVGFNTSEARQVKAGVIEGLSHRDIAESVYGNRGTYSINRVREVVAWLVQHGLD